MAQSGEEWESITSYRDMHKLASYIAKYVGKKMDSRKLNQKRYFHSRGIVLPEMNTWRIGSTDMLEAVQTAFAVAAEAVALQLPLTP